MPLDNSFDWIDDSFKSHCLGWQLKLSLWPRHCYYTKKRIWFKYAYKGVAMWTGPGDPVYETRWVDRKEFLFQKLIGKI